MLGMLELTNAGTNQIERFTPNGNGVIEIPPGLYKPVGEIQGFLVASTETTDSAETRPSRPHFLHVT